MNQPKKLSEQELASIRKTLTYASWEAIFADKHNLEAHIDAITAEHKAELEAAAAQAREDADRVGAARIAFEDEQQKRIEEAEAENERLGGYTAFLYSCAKSGEQPETYEWYLEKNRQFKARNAQSDGHTQ